MAQQNEGDRKETGELAGVKSPQITEATLVIENFNINLISASLVTQ